MTLRGIGLVEIIVAILIMSVFTGAGIHFYSGIARNSRIAVLRTNLSSIRKCLEDFSYDRGCYPDRLSRLAEPGPAGYRYLRRLPVDPFTRSADWEVLKGSTTAPSWVKRSLSYEMTGEIFDVRSCRQEFQDL